ncbi:MAG: FAD/NAD(P)-binding protein [Rickettsiales bacterium]|nr:FAD/NAD(P)-binding protein [Rickettsiales bacterium]
MKTIAIVGFGFCGKIIFSHLAKSSEKKYRILIFNKADQGLESVAFADFSPHYILNVPANKMSAFSADEKDFCNFLQKNYPKIFNEIGEFGFAPRQIYQQYLQEIFLESLVIAKKNKLDFSLINQEVLKVQKNNSTEEFLIKTKEKNFSVDQIILATSVIQSNFAPQILKNITSKFDQNYFIKNLWHKNYLNFHQEKIAQKKICLIGSGLSAVDVIVGLKNKNFTGKIFVVARRGNFPKKHFIEAPKNINFISVADAKKGIVFLCLKIRYFLRANSEFDLRHVVDSIRSITQNLWQNFDQKNKKLFLRLLPYWNIFRHRAPISSIEIIEKMIASKQLEIKKGGLKSAVKLDGKFLIETKFEKFECDYLVNCLGFEFDAKKYALLNQMIEEDLLKPDLMMVQSNHEKIHLLGGLNIGKDFECTSVPDLRADVEKLIKIL